MTSQERDDGKQKKKKKHVFYFSSLSLAFALCPANYVASLPAQ